jgi:hypothetical protein
MGEEPDRVAMVSDVRRELSVLRSELSAELRSELSARIKEEGETTRRHFNVMVEKVEAAVKIVAEVNARHAVVLDNHENRLSAIEKTR